MYIFILIILKIIIEVYSKEISINNEDQLLEVLKTNDDINELIITISDISIDFENEIKLNNKIEKLSIKGISKELSILNFKNITSGFIFDNSIKNVFINNITIKGYLEFNNNSNIDIDNVIINGSTDFISNKNSPLVNINELQFYGLSDGREYCINLQGNIIIENSYFFGNPTCRNGIIYYDGENINSLNIFNTYFDGAYSNQCLNINNSNKIINIKNCIFERGASFENGG